MTCKLRQDLFTQLRLLQFNNDIFDFTANKLFVTDTFVLLIFVADKFTQDTLDALNNDILDCILYNTL